MNEGTVVVAFNYTKAWLSGQSEFIDKYWGDDGTSYRGNVRNVYRRTGF
jgi:hypothetical protein